MTLNTVDIRTEIDNGRLQYGDVEAIVCTCGHVVREHYLNLFDDDRGLCCMCNCENVVIEFEV